MPVKTSLVLVDQKNLWEFANFIFRISLLDAMNGLIIIWIGYHRVKEDPLRSQNHDELKSSTVGPSNKKKKMKFFLAIFFQEQKMFLQEQILISFLCIIFWIFKNYKVNWQSPLRISIHRDFASLGGPLSPCGSHWLR